ATRRYGPGLAPSGSVPRRTTMPTERITTTHTGSLPRPAALLRSLEEARARPSVDAAPAEALLTQAVAECVDRQIASGIDIGSDGELGKPSYATYVKDRLTGFGGEGS